MNLLLFEQNLTVTICLENRFHCLTIYLLVDLHQAWVPLIKRKARKHSEFSIVYKQFFEEKVLLKNVSSHVDICLSYLNHKVLTFTGLEKDCYCLHLQDLNLDSTDL